MFTASAGVGRPWHTGPWPSCRVKIVSRELESAQQVQQSAKGSIDAARALSKNRPPLGLLQGIVPAHHRFVLRPPAPPATPTFSPREHLDSLNLRKGSREGLEAAFNARVKDPRLFSTLQRRKIG